MSKKYNILHIPTGLLWQGPQCYVEHRSLIEYDYHTRFADPIINIILCPDGFAVVYSPYNKRTGRVIQATPEEFEILEFE